MSPVFFILTSLALTSAVLSVIFFIAWRTLDRMPHALTWSITFLFATVQWTINLNSARFATYEMYWIVVSMVTLAVVSFGLLGHCQRVRSTACHRAFFLPPLLCFATIVYFTVIAPHEGARVGIGPAYAATTMLIAAVLILRHRRRTRPAEWGAAISLILFALTQYVAAGAAFLQGPRFNQAYYDVYVQVNFLGLPAAYTAAGMFVVFMIASDLSEMMKEAAVRDDLTGLLNRRGFCEASEKAYATARRTGRPVSIVMTDIDFFKKINDSHGHHVGDQAIKHVAENLTWHRRCEDIVARVGGEEFAVVLPGTGLQAATRLAQKMCQRLHATPMPAGRIHLAMTASFGVATLALNDTCMTDAIVRADEALYRAKHGGRNRVVVEGVANQPAVSLVSERSRSSTLRVSPSASMTIRSPG